MKIKQDHNFIFPDNQPLNSLFQKHFLVIHNIWNVLMIELVFRIQISGNNNIDFLQNPFYFLNSF